MNVEHTKGIIARDMIRNLLLVYGATEEALRSLYSNLKLGDFEDDRQKVLEALESLASLPSDDLWALVCAADTELDEILQDHERRSVAQKTRGLP